MYKKGSIQPGSAKARLLELLDGTPNGLHSEQISIMLAIGEQQANTAAYQLGKSGLVVGVSDGFGKATQRKRWCLPKHEAFCRSAIQASAATAKVWRKAGLGRVPSGLPERAAVVTDKTKVTICSANQDTRFSVGKVQQPFFSANGPGVYTVSSGSAIERAYGPRRAWSE